MAHKNLNGCGKNTQILLSSGEYKNITLLQIGDSVINMNGDPVLVKNIYHLGCRNICDI
jgi:hypothetical protein